MSHETRVNLLHLLEDIRDSYAMPLEEVTITELIANALDSEAAQINLTMNPVEGFFRVTDNGRGMRRPELKEYHNIAATAKVRGRGIGFAGIGAKLSLLLADRVITETKGPRGTRSATEWRLLGPLRAPWKYIPSSGEIPTPKGTAVTIFLKNRNSSLLEAKFVARAIQKHYHTFFHTFLGGELQRYVYRKAIEFRINGEKFSDIIAPHSETTKSFRLIFGKRDRRPVGFGYIARVENINETPEGLRGLAISTFGKIIKTGWEWTGIIPRSYETIYGVVEIPGLAEILTTNKADFLNDSTSLKKYYRYRKAVQEAVRPILQEWGEERPSVEGLTRRPRPLEREIKGVLGLLLSEFPELTPLVRLRYRPGEGAREKSKNKREAHLSGIRMESKLKEEGEDGRGVKAEDSPLVSQKGKNSGRKKESGLRIGFEAGISVESLARLDDDTVWINTQHHAWNKAKREGAENYHVISATAWALSSFLEENRSAQSFVARFLSVWGKEKETPRLF